MKSEVVGALVLSGEKVHSYVSEERVVDDLHKPNEADHHPGRSYVGKQKEDHTLAFRFRARDTLSSQQLRPQERLSCRFPLLSSYQLNRIAEGIGYIDRLCPITMALQWAKFLCVSIDDCNMCRVLSGSDQSQLNVGEIKQGPGIVLVVDRAVERRGVPRDRLLNVRHDDGDMLYSVP